MMGSTNRPLKLQVTFFPPQIEKLPQEESLEIVAFIFESEVFLPTDI